MTYDEMIHEIELEMHRLQRENKRLKEKLVTFDAMRQQVDTLTKRNKVLSKELAAIRRRSEAMTGFSVMKM